MIEMLYNTRVDLKSILAQKFAAAANVKRRDSSRPDSLAIDAIDEHLESREVN